MRTNNQKKRLNIGSFFRKVGALLTGTALLASTNLTTAALANNQGERQAIFNQLRLDNPDAGKKELHQLFKQEWREIKGVGNGAGGVGGAGSVIQNQAIQNINNAPNHLDRNDFANKAEWQAAKQQLKLEQKTLNATINQTVQQTANKLINVNAGFALDLTSAVQSITLGDKLFKNQESVTIKIDGQDKTLSAGSKVTAAEYVAAKQAMAGGAQTVTLDADGRATGGSVDLSAMTAGNKTMKVSDLTVPVAVTASGDFGKGGDVKITGDLTNNGSITAYSSGKNNVSALIKADNITNNAGASIDSQVANLTLQADNNLSNYGDISATGNLTLNAGSGLTNSGSVNVAKNLNVLAPNVTNTGNIASASGNITFDTPVPTALNITNTNGTVSALNGAINIRDQKFNAAFDSNINGGDFLSNQFNINAGGGTVNVNVDNLTGVVSGAGYGTHVTVNSADTLKLGNLDFIDPTFYNSVGNIDITGDISVADALTIIASGDITSADGVTITAKGGAGGFPITLIAGANVTGTFDQSTVPPIGGGTVGTIDGTLINSASGGNVALGTGVTINATQVTAPPADFSGADVNIIALEGTGLTNGNVTLGGVTINTGGGGTGANGSVNIFAGGSGAKTIGAINTAGGSGTAGNVNIVMAQAVNSSTGDDIVYAANGSLTTGPGFGSLVAGTSFGTGTTTLAGTITAGSGAVVATAADDINVTGTVAGNSIQVTTTTGSGGDIQLNSTLTSSGASNQVVLSADGSITGTSTVTGTTVSLTATNGNIGTSAASRVSTNATNLNATSNGTLGNGNVWINEADGVTLNASSANDQFLLNTLAAGDLDVQGAVTGNDIQLTTFATGGGNILLNNTLTSSGAGDQVVLSADGSITGNSTVTGTTVSLTATNGNIGTSAASRISTNATNLDATANAATIGNGSVWINEADGVTLNGGSADKQFRLNTLAAGDLDVQGAVTGNDIRLTTFATGGGNILLNNTLTSSGAGNQVVLSADGSITGTSTVSGTTVSLTATNGNIGTSAASRVSTSATNLSATANGAAVGNGNVWINEADGVSLNASSANKQFLLNTLAAGDVDVQGAVTGNDIQLTTFATGGGNILLNNTLTSSGAGNQVVLSADGSITGASTVSGTTVSLTATNGNIGTSAASRVNTNATNLDATANAATVGNGNVWINEANGVAVNASSANKQFLLNTLAAGSIDINGAVSANDIQLTTFGSGQAVNVNSTLSAPSVTLNSDVFNMTGSINAGVGTVTIRPITNGTTISVAGGAATLDISSTELANITAGTLVVGDRTLGGGITVGGNIDVSGVGAGAYNLTFLNAGNFTSAGQTITLGSKNLLIDVGGSITTGTVNSTSGNVDLTAVSNITTGTTTTTSGNVVFDAGNNINAGATSTDSGNITMDAGNNIVAGPTSTNTGTIDLDAGGTISIGDIVSNEDVILITVGTLNVANITTTGDIYLKSTAGGINTTGNLLADPIVMIAASNITLGGDVTANDGILIVSGRNVVTTSVTPININGSSTVGDAGAVTIVAGANFTDNGIGNDVVINGASATGGNIDFTQAGGLTSITSDSSFAGGSGGNVSLIAFGTGAGLNGRVLLPTSSAIVTTGNGAGTNGYLAVVAGGNNAGNGVQLGTVVTQTSGTGGDVDIYTAQPQGGVSISQNVADTGAYTAGAFFGGPTRTANISTSDITAVGADVTATAGRSGTFGSVTSATMGLTALAGSLASTGIITGSTSVTLTARNSITNALFAGGISSPILNLTSTVGSIGSSGDAFIVDASTLSANAAVGSVYLTNSAQNITLNASSGSTFELTRTSALAGNITVNGPVGGSNVRLLNVAGNGGVVVNDTISAIGGGNATSVVLTASGSGAISTDGAAITTNALSLTSGSGNIGAGTAINTNANSLTFSTTGDVTITDTRTGTVTLNASNANNATVNLTTANSGLVVAGIVDAANDLTLSTVGTGNITRSGASTVLNVGNLLTLTAGGSIGTLSTPVLTNAAQITSSAGGSIFISENDAVTLNATNAGGSVNIAAGGDMTINDISGTSANLSTVNGGNIIQNSGSITATTVALTSDTGNIGSGAQAIITSATNLSANTAGTVDITGTAANINLGASSGSSFNITRFNVGPGILTVSGPLSAGVITLTSSAGGMIAINSAIGGQFGGNATSTTIETDTGNVTTNGALISTSGLTLVSNDGSFGTSSSKINTNAGTLTATTAGDVYVSDTGSVQLNASQGATFSLTSAGSITMAGALTTNSAILTTTNNGNIALDNMVFLNSGPLFPSLVANANGSGNITRNAGTSLFSGFLTNVSLTSGSGNIGTAANRITYDGGGTGVSTSGNVYLGVGTGGLQLNGTAGGILNVTSVGAIDFNAATNAGSVVASSADQISVNAPLTATSTVSLSAGGAGISLASSITAPTSITLSVSGTGDITNTVGAAALLSTNTLNATTGSGTVGATNDVFTNASNINVSSTSGDIAITDTFAGVINLNTLSTGAASTATFTATGANNVITTVGTVQAGTLSLIAGTGSNGSINLGSNATATNAASSLTLSANGTGSISGSGVATGNTVNLSSGSGNIGSISSNVNTNTDNLFVSTTGNAFVNEVDGLNTGTSTANTYQLTAGGLINIQGVLSANNVTVQSNGGSINIDENIQGVGIGGTRANSVTLAVSGVGSINNIDGDEIIFTNALNMTSGSGNIGATGNRIRTNANTLSGSTTGNFFVTNISGSPFTIGNVSANDIGINGLVSGANMIIGGNVTGATSITLSTNGAGTITRTGASVLTAPTVSLTAASIGDISNRVLTSAGTLSAVATAGGAFISEANAVTLAGTSSATAEFDLIAGGALTVNDLTGGTSVTLATTNGGSILSNGITTITTPILSVSSDSGLINVSTTAGAVSGSTTNDLSIDSTATAVNVGAVSGAAVSLTSAGSLALLQNVNGTSSVSLTATGTGTVSQAVGRTINTPSLTVTAGSGNIGNGGTLVTNAGQLVANTTGNVNITDTFAGPVLINGMTGNNITVNSTGVNSSLVVNNTITSTGNTNLLAGVGTNGGIIINANINAGGVANLTADGTGNISNPAGVVTATGVNLTSGSGNIGTFAKYIQIDAANMTANTSGNVYVNNTHVDLTPGAGIALGTSSGNNFNITFSDDLTVGGGGIFGNIVNLTANGGTNAGVILNNTSGSSSITGTVSITINADGSGTISQIPGASSLLNTPTVVLTSGTGDIGSQSNPIYINATNVTATTSGAVYLSNSNTGTVNLGPASGTDFYYLNNGTINVVGVLDFSNDVTLITTNNGSINVNASIIAGGVLTLTAGGIGNITQALGTLLDTPTLVATSSGGNIGSLTSPLTTNASTLTVRTTGLGSAWVNDINSTQNINLVGINGAGNTFNLTVAGGAGLYVTTAPGVGNIVQANTANITSLNGSVGNTAANPLTTDVGDLSVTASLGDVYVQDVGSLNVTGITAGGNVVVAANNDLSTSGEVASTGNNSEVVLAALNGALDINDAVNATTTGLLSGVTLDGSAISDATLNSSTIAFVSLNGNINLDLVALAVTPNLANAAFDADQGSVLVNANSSTLNLQNVTFASLAPLGPSLSTAANQADGFNVSNAGNINVVDSVDGGSGALQLSTSLNGLITVTSTGSTNAAGQTNLFGQGGVSVQGGATVTSTGSNINITGAGVSIGGTVSATDSTSGSVNIQATGGDVLLDTGSSVTANQATGNAVTVSATNNVDFSGNIDAVGSIDVQATSDFSAASGSTADSTAGSISVNAGGTSTVDCSITANTTVGITSVGTNSVLANGSVSGTTVSLTSSGADLQIGGNLTGSTAINLSSNSDLLNVNILGGTFTTPQLNLTSTAGSVGESGDSLTLTGGSNVNDPLSATFNAFTNVYVAYDGSALTIGGGKSSANGVFDVSSTGDLTTTGAIDPTDVVLHSDGDMLLNSVISASNSITLTAVGNIDNPLGSLQTPGLLTATSDTGWIGTNSQRLNTQVGTIALHATLDSAYATNTGGDLTVNQSDAAGDLCIDTEGTMTVAGALTGNGVSLLATTVGPLNGDVLINASITASGANSVVDIDADRDVISTTPGTIDGNTILISAGRDLTVGGAITGTMEVGDVSDSTLVLTATGAFSNSAIISGNDISVNADTIQLNALVQGVNVNNVVSLTAEQSITGVNVNGNLSAETLNLTSNTGSVGALGDEIRVAVANISIDASNHAYVVNDGNLNILASTAGGILNVSTDATGLGGDITVSGALSGFDVVVQAYAGSLNNGDLAINASVTASGGGVVLTADRDLSSSAAGDVSGRVVDIDAGRDINLSGTVASSGPSNKVTIDAAAGSITLNSGADVTGVDITIQAATGLTINSNIGDGLTNQMVLGTTTGALTTGSAAAILGNSITMTSGGTIDVGFTVTSNAAFGNVYIEADGSVTTQSGAAIFGNGINIISDNSTVTLNGTVTGNSAGNFVDIDANGTITTNTGAILSGETISVSSSAGSVDINDDVIGVNTVTVDGFTGVTTGNSAPISGTDVIITSSTGGIQFGSTVTGGTTGSVDISADGSVVTLAGAVISANDIDVQSNSSFVTIGANVTGTGTASTVDITASGLLTTQVGTAITGHTIALTSVTDGLSLAGTIDSTGAVGNSVSLTAFNDITAANVANVSAESLSLASTNGSVGTDFSGGEILVSGVTNLTVNAAVDSFIRIDGDINLVGTNVVVGNFSFGGGSTGGSIDVTGTVNAGQFNTSLGGTNGGDLTVSSTGSVTAGAMNLLTFSGTGANGDVTVSGVLKSTNGISFSADGDVTTTGAAFIEADFISFNAANINVTTKANGASVIATGATGATIVNQGNFELQSATVTNTLDVSTDVTIGGDITVSGLSTANVLNLTANSGTLPANGDIILNASITGTTSVTLTADGGIQDNAVITSADVTLNAVTGVGSSLNPVEVTNNGNAMTLTVNAAGVDAFVNYLGTNTLTLNTSSSDDFTLTATQSTGFLATGGDSTFTGDLNIFTNDFTNANDLSAGNINITSLTGSGLTLDGGAGGSFTATAPGGLITVTALANNLTLEGNTTYTTEARLFANQDGQSVDVTAGSVSTAVVTSYIFTSNLIYTGSLVIYTPPTGAPGDTWIVTNGGTYSQNPGDLNLTGNFSTGGANIAFISEANINFTAGATINTSSANGGSITMLAGYDYVPTGSYTGDVGQAFTNFTANSTGGNITGGAIINTSGTAGAAGSVLVVANGGLTNGGTVNLGSITANGTTTGGNVTVIAEGGINMAGATIDTTGTTGDGSVTLAVASAVVPGTFQIQNGTASGGAITVGTATAGNLAYGSINAGAADVTLTGALGATDTIATTGTTTANNLNVNTGIGAANIGNTTVATLNVTGDGQVTLNNSTALALGTFSGASDIDVTAAGAITGGSGTVDSLTASGSSIDLSGTLTAASFADLTSTAGDILGGIDTQDLTLDATGNIGTGTSGRFTSNADNWTANATGSAFISATNAGGVTIDGASGAGSTFDMTATGNLSSLVAGTVGATDVVLNTGGSFDLDGAVTGTTIGLTSVNSMNNASFSGGLNTGDLSLTVTAGDIGATGVGNAFNVTNGANPLSLTVNTGTGDSFINYTGTNVLTLMGSSGDNFTATTSGVGSSFATGANSTFNGNVSITTNDMTNAFVLTSDNGNIAIQSLALSGLTIDGGAGGTYTATNGSITITATADDLSIFGVTTYTTAASLSASGAGQSVILNAGSNSIANAPSFIFTSDVQFNGGVLTDAPGPWSIVNSGTYANDPGDVTISGAINISGGNLAIIAGGNIDLTGASFDLSGTDGGSLTMLAGFDFVPQTGGTQVNNDVSTIYDTFTNSAGGGNIIGGANIDLSGSAGNGGSLIALASGGITNAGTVTLGNITTSGTNNGGAVRIIASSDITTGTITTTAGTGSSGAVDLTVGTPTVGTGTNFQIQGGVIITGANTIANADLTTGTITVGTVDAGFSSFSAQTGASGAIVIGGGLSAKDITLNTGALTFSSLTTLSSSSDSNGDAGTIDVTASSVTVTGGHLILQAQGTGAGDGGVIDFTYNNAGPVTLGTSGLFEFQIGASGTGDSGSATFTSLGNVTLDSNSFVGTSGGNGGGAVVNTTQGIAVLSGAFDLTGALNGATISLTAGGGMDLSAGVGFFSQANAVGANSDGGTLILRAASYTLPTNVGTSAGNALNLTATANGTGDNGTIVFETNSTTQMFVGAPAKAPKGAAFFVTANASGGGGDAGSITLATGGNLTINDINALNASSSFTAGGNLDGASYSLTAGRNGAAGNLVVNGLLDGSSFNSGAGGDITLASRSTQAFVVNSSNVPKNGTFGTVTTDDGGVVTISNLNGGVTLTTSNAVVADDQRFNLGGKGKFTAKGFTVNALDNLSINSTGASALTNLSVNTANLSVTTVGGTVSLTNVFNGSWNLENATGKSLTINTGVSGSVTLNDMSASAGNILVVNNSGNLVVANDATITATNGSLTLQNTNLSGQIQIGTNAVVETAGTKGKTTTLTVSTTIPKTGINPTTTSVGNINVTVEGKGVVFLGPTGAVVAASPVNVNALNKNVIFNGPVGSIVLGAGSTVTADPPSTASAASASAPAVAAALPAQPANTSGLFGFVSENATVTSDLSVLSLNAAPQMQVANNATLMTATNTASLAAQAGLPVSNGVVNTGAINTGVSGLASIARTTSVGTADEDNSYVVGFCSTTGETQAAICTDAEIGMNAGMQDVQTVQHGERVVIKKGNVLFVPFKATTVETPNGIVHIDAKSVALVSSTDAGLAVYDLEDQHKGSVSVESNGHNVVLAPGRHVMITKHHTAEFAQINAVETIAHRNVQSVVKNGHRAHTSEFSLLTAMDTVKPLKALASSKHANARQIADRMMKTTAIILQLGGGSGGQYQHYFKPRMTAKM